MRQSVQTVVYGNALLRSPRNAAFHLKCRVFHESKLLRRLALLLNAVPGKTARALFSHRSGVQCGAYVPTPRIPNSKVLRSAPFATELSDGAAFKAERRSSRPSASLEASVPSAAVTDASSRRLSTTRAPFMLLPRRSLPLNQWPDALQKIEGTRFV